MSIEQMGNNENEKVKLGNQMQAMLAEKHGEPLVDFVDLHAEDFRSYLDKNAEVLEEFKHNPQKALQTVEDSIYH
jgi:hypothetical protein